MQSLLKHSSAVPVDGQQLDEGVQKLYDQSINYLNLLLVKSIEQVDNRGNQTLCDIFSSKLSIVHLCMYPLGLFSTS